MGYMGTDEAVRIVERLSAIVNRTPAEDRAYLAALKVVTEMATLQIKDIADEYLFRGIPRETTKPEA